MSEKHVTIAISNGEVIINHAWIDAESPDVVAICVDMDTKRPEIIAQSYSDVPGLLLSANEGTFYTNADKAGTPTHVTFPGFSGWTVHCADVARYTIHVCLTRN
jgi:hypothetical protein